MREIKYPNETTYWVVKNSNGEIILSGITEPENVTTTGAGEFEIIDKVSYEELNPETN